MLNIGRRMPIFLIRERSSALWEELKNNGQFVANMYGFGMIWYGYVDNGMKRYDLVNLIR